MFNYLLAGYLVETAEDSADPEIQLHVTHLSQARLREQLSDTHSKGTAYSCAVATENLMAFLGPEDFRTLETLFGLEAAMAGESLYRLVNALLMAGAQFALRIPAIGTLMPPQEKLVP